MKTPDCVGRRKVSARNKKGRALARAVATKNSTTSNKKRKDNSEVISRFNSGDKFSIGILTSILKKVSYSTSDKEIVRPGNNGKAQHCNFVTVPTKVDEIDKTALDGKIKKSASATTIEKIDRKPPKPSPSRSSASFTKIKKEDTVIKNEKVSRREGPPVLQTKLYTIRNSENSTDSCPSVIKPILQEPTESPTIVAPPPSGYFIRDDISTEEDVTTICCNQHGDKILDNVPLCTFGYQGWSAAPYTYDVSPECDSNCSPRPSPSLFPSYKRRESPTKKTKKVKRRRRNISKARDSSDFSGKNKGKQNVDLKKGIALKQGSKKEVTQTLRYKQRVINPKNPKLFQTMGNLPVSIDSVLYYYEPHGKQMTGKARRKGYLQGRNNSRKTIKNATNNQSKKRLSINKVKTEDVLLLNTNENANTSDIDLSELKQSTDTTPAQSCTRQNGASNLQSSFETDLRDTVGNMLPGDYSSLYFEDLESEFKRRILSEGGTKESARETGELGKTIERAGPFSIDNMVNDFIQNAYKEETEYEQSLLPEKLQSVSKQNEENLEAVGSLVGNCSMASVPCKSHKVIPKKATLTEKEKSKIPERSMIKMTSKVLNVKAENQTSLRQMKKKSLSTPNIYPGRSEKEGHDMESGIFSPTTSVLMAQKGESENMVCRSQTSPQLAYVSVDSRHLDNVCQTGEFTVDSGNDVSPIMRLNEDDYLDAGKQKERGRVKKTQKTSSILRKPTTNSQEDKRNTPQVNKTQGKSKQTSSFTKSHSFSPTSKKRVGQVILGLASNKKSKDVSEIPKKTGKKTKKKVRIVVDVNGIQPDKSHIDDDFCEYRDVHGEGFDDGEIEDNQAYLAGLLEKCKSECEQFQNEESYDEQKRHEISRDHDIQSYKGDNFDAAFCGFSETNSDQESLSSSPRIREVTQNVTKPTKEKKHKKSSKQIEKENKEKGNAAEKEKIQAEKGWDNNFIIQKEDSKTKVALKKKRYQLKKASDVHLEKSRSDADDLLQLEKLRNSTDVDIACKKAMSQTGNKLQKPNSKKRPFSPKQATKKGADGGKCHLELDPKEGTSVDAPGFNNKREFCVRTAKSAQAVNVSKQSTKESVLNQPTNIGQAQRVKMARDNAFKYGRKKSPSPLGERYTSSIADQISPITSRSTDLDVAFSYRRQQLSPGRSAAIGRLARRDSKIGQSSKYRSKSESEENKQKIVEAGPSSSYVHDSGRLQHTDPMDMNVLNLGLSWMIQGLMRRFSIFNHKDSNEQPTEQSVQETTRDLETVQN